MFYLCVDDLDGKTIFDRIKQKIIFIGFEPIYCVINLDTILSFMVFIDLVYVFSSIYC